ncbi:zinc finger protein 3 homolog isoform X1 [Pseudomyrmex gracilis]|uniref:zinc finger protein 3 homolog isoform X1 n=2 Tax=Pseudomyrmex gracilis TaxID=219809 RepID=UPI00099497B1|nr:zinc finger protein 3 homolog isoform X1 [Pseudomyrmex gracilis]XP_020292302.1 zinc finger protein 3 homolog isoform X1 [Pseudomyrmex gracilis]
MRSKLRATGTQKMAIAASENYQLKWHSYGAHLHSSVATLLHSESFADVLLATSCGRHVAAHRFVLAACSSYLSHIFQTCHFGANTNAPIIVVLPTEIGYRTLKILIQYMYSGEATVTNDQLEGVLKAGDILRVRGLWRSNTGSSKKENIQSNNQKIERDKREPTQLAGQIQKIKLIQPTQEKVADSAQQQQAAPTCQNNVQSTKSVERKSIEKTEEKTNEPEPKKVLEENQNNEQNKNKENLETNGKKKKAVNSDVESTKSKSSEGGENTELNLELLVKDEPIDWEESIDPSESLTIDHEIDIKPEIVHSADEDGDIEEEEYTPLTCDMCSQTFNRPSDWVKHIEFTHADMTENRRKRRKDDMADDNKEFPPLKCDLCGNMYSTPQEWVRHIQTEHTEEQLALMNNSAPPKPKRVHNHQKLCNICQKEFPSHASMVIHQRTHTGEKPFLCSYCKKGFNVKSNLLRHLRTLHDKYVHPSLYGSNGCKNT